MTRLVRRLLLALPLLLLLPAGTGAAQAQAQDNSTPSETTQASPSAATANGTYALSGDKLAKAVKISQIRTTVHFVSAGWGILYLILLLAFGVPAKLRDWAVAAHRNWWFQGLIFVPLFSLLTTILELPIELYMQHVERAYGLSVQSWGSWTIDALKGFAISLVGTYLFLMLVKWRMTRSPRTWWLQAWVVMIPIVIFMVFLAPVVIEPMFNKFEPLQPVQPVLVSRLEQVVARGGLTIPPDRMKLMKASLKTTQLNAYVSGIGASKQVVVWDTSIQKASQDEILFIFGHEMGHYVLNHIPKIMTLMLLSLLVLFYVAYRSIQWAIAKWGPAWKVPAPQDWAGLAVFMLAMSVFGFLAEPITNGISRHFEHEADVYGLEAVHGIVADPQAVASHAFQVLGETSLVDPAPNAFVEFWTGSHPSLPSRQKFAAEYDPWAPGKHPKFFKK